MGILSPAVSFCITSLVGNPMSAAARLPYMIVELAVFAAVSGLFSRSRDMYREIYEEAQKHDGPFMERLAFYMVNFSGHIERDGLKLCQEWVRNTVDPDLVENPYDKEKLRMDADSMKGMIKRGVEWGELKETTPVDALADALTDVIYGEMLCWDMAGGAYSFEERTKKFCDTFLPAMMKPYLNGDAQQ